MALDGIFLSKIKDELIREICFSRVPGTVQAMSVM